TGAAGPQDVGVMVFAPDGDRIAWLRKNTSGTIELEMRELPSGAPVRHSLGVLPADIYAFWLTPDPRPVVVRQGDPLRGPSTVVVRSLDGGDVLATTPEKSVVVLSGAAVAACRNGTFETGAAVLVTPTHGTPAPTQVRALNSACYGLAISAD